MNIQNIMAQLEAKHPGEKEYLQAVHEVLLSIEEVYNQQWKEIMSMKEAEMTAALAEGKHLDFSRGLERLQLLKLHGQAS